MIKFGKAKALISIALVVMAIMSFSVFSLSVVGNMSKKDAAVETSAAYTFSSGGISYENYSSNSTFYINSAAGFKTFVESIGNKLIINYDFYETATYSGKTIYLTSDVESSDYIRAVLSDGDVIQSASFKGIFDGQGHTISGFTFFRTIFGNNEGTIKNVKIKNCTIQVQTSGINTNYNRPTAPYFYRCYDDLITTGGGFLTNKNSGTISCVMMLDLESNFAINHQSVSGINFSDSHFGTICFYNTGTIEDCDIYSSAYVSVSLNISGSTDSYLYAYKNAGTISNCVSQDSSAAQCLNSSASVSNSLLGIVYNIDSDFGAFLRYDIYQSFAGWYSPAGDSNKNLSERNKRWIFRCDTSGNMYDFNNGYPMLTMFVEDWVDIYLSTGQETNEVVISHSSNDSYFKTYLSNVADGEMILSVPKVGNEKKKKSYYSNLGVSTFRISNSFTRVTISVDGYASVGLPEVVYSYDSVIVDPDEDDFNQVEYIYEFKTAYTVRFDGNGGTPSQSSINVVEGGTISSLPTASRNYYEFKGWFTSASGGATLTTSTKITQDITYYAQWNPRSYSITYKNEDGGTFDSSWHESGYPTKHTFNTATTLKSASRTGYQWVGWRTAANGSGTITTSIPADTHETITLYADWTVINFNIILHTNGGTISDSPYTETEGAYSASVNVETGTYLPTPTHVGYNTFEGWSRTNSTTTPSDVDTTVSYSDAFNAGGKDGSVTYYAYYSDSISFNIKYYQQIEDREVTDFSYSPPSYSPASLTSISDPEKVGYRFTGWSGTGLEGETNKDISIPIGSTGEKEYTAHFEIIDYTITLNLGAEDVSISLDSNWSGTGSSRTREYNVESANISLPEPTRTGYTFTGWSGTELSGQVEEVTVANGSIGNREYTANWEIIPYTITYELNEGSVSSDNPTEYTVETQTFTLNNPTKEGYDFYGWTGSNGTTPQETVTIAKGSTGDRTYTANWKKISFTLTFGVPELNGSDFVGSAYEIYKDDTKQTGGTVELNVYWGAKVAVEAKYTEGGDEFVFTVEWTDDESTPVNHKVEIKYTFTNSIYELTSDNNATYNSVTQGQNVTIYPEFDYKSYGTGFTPSKTTE